jgi:phosphoglycolate phosphatase
MPVRMTITCPMHHRAALIDLDGTLVDTLADFTVSLNAMLADLNLAKLTGQQVEALIGKGSEYLIRGALDLQTQPNNTHHSESSYEKAWQLYQTHYRANNGLHSRIYPGVVEGLEQMKQWGWSLACVTNKPAAFARELLRQKGLSQYFEHVTGGDSYPRKKPDPMPLLKTCEVLQTEPQRALMIGDSIHDAHAAQAAGCPLVLVTYGYHHGADLTALGALQTVQRLDHVVFDTLSPS